MLYLYEFDTGMASESYYWLNNAKCLFPIALLEEQQISMKFLINYLSKQYFITKIKVSVNYKTFEFYLRYQYYFPSFTPK